MADHILSPTKESANAILYMRDLLAIMGNKKLADKSARGLVDAAEKLAGVHGGIRALTGARKALVEAESKLDAAEAEAVARLDEVAKAEDRAQQARQRERESLAAQQETLNVQKAGLNDRDTKARERENAVTARESAVKALEDNLGARTAEAENALKRAERREKAAAAVKAEYGDKVKALKAVTGG